MTDLSDDQITALCDAATPGEWYPDRHIGGNGSVVMCDAGYRLAHLPKLGDGLARFRNDEADAELMAAARSLVPALLARAQAAEAAVQRLLSALERTEGNFQLAIAGKPVRDMDENLAENAAARAAVEGTAS